MTRVSDACETGAVSCAKAAEGGKGGSDGGVYKDAWGAAYSISLDTSYDNRISNNLTTVIVSSAGGSTDTNKIISNVK